MLAEPAQALTDLALGVVAVSLAVQLRRAPSITPHWRRVFWWFGAAALAGFVHHGVIVRSAEAAQVSWAVISSGVVIAVSFLLAATVVEVLGPGRSRAFWLLRSVGVVAYVVLAALGFAGVGTMLACEGLTMLSVLGLWAWAAYRDHPLGRPMLLAIAASIGASAAHLPAADVLQGVGLDPNSTYHLAQIVGIVLLFRAVTGFAGRGADGWARRVPAEAGGTP